MREITLVEPLVRRSKESGDIVDQVTTVNVRRLKTGDLLSALDGAGDGGKGLLMAHLMSRATRLTVAQVRELELEDFAAISEVVESFLPASLRTGPMLSSSSQGPSDIPQDATTGDPSD